MSRQDGFSVLETGGKEIMEGYYLDNIGYTFEIKKEVIYLKGCKDKRLVGKRLSGGTIVYSNYECGKEMGPAYILSRTGSREVYSITDYIYGEPIKSLENEMDFKDFKGSYEYSLLPDNMQLFFELFDEDSAVYIFRNHIIIRPTGANWIISFKKLSNFPHLMDVSGNCCSGSVRAIIINGNLKVCSSDEYKIAVLCPTTKNYAYLRVEDFDTILGFTEECSKTGDCADKDLTIFNFGNRIPIGPNGPIELILPYVNNNAIKLYGSSINIPTNYIGKNYIVELETEHKRIKKIYNEDREVYLKNLEEIMRVLCVELTSFYK